MSTVGLIRIFVVSLVKNRRPAQYASGLSANICRVVMVSPGLAFRPLDRHAVQKYVPTHDLLAFVIYHALVMP